MPFLDIKSKTHCSLYYFKGKKNRKWVENLKSIEHTAKEIITQVLLPEEEEVSEIMYEDLCDILIHGVFS